MNALAKWNPFRQLEDIHTRLRSLFGRTPLRGSTHIIVAALVIAAAITQCGEQHKTKQPTPVEFWF